MPVNISLAIVGSIPIFLGVPALLEATVLTESVGPMNALLLSSCIGYGTYFN